MSDPVHEDAYNAWRSSLTTLMGDAALLARWQERRYQFAHRVGALLTEEHADSSVMVGPVLYGVFASGAGLCYVGQTQEAERRLRDLPVGESHHLANTVPPEVWERVVVIRWPLLLSEAPASEQAEVKATVDATTQAVTRRYTKPFGETRGTTPSTWPDDTEGERRYWVAAP